VDYKCPAGAYPLRHFSRNLQSLHLVSAVKIQLDLLKGLWSYGGFKLRGSGYPKFSPPPSDETMRHHHTSTTVLRPFFRDYPSQQVPEKKLWSLLHAKFQPKPCNVSPLQGEKPQNRPLSNLNTGALRRPQCCR